MLVEVFSALRFVKPIGRDRFRRTTVYAFATGSVGVERTILSVRSIASGGWSQPRIYHYTCTAHSHTSFRDEPTAETECPHTCCIQSVAF